ncbi:MAG: PIN domain-containing protein [Chloroflexia bacterium]
MRVLLDTNVLLDVLLERPPFNSEAGVIWQLTTEARITAYVTSTTLTDIFYLGRKQLNRERAWEAVHLCLEAFELLPVDQKTVMMAVSLSGKDFEDNLQVACASIANLDAIITRDKAGFSFSSVNALTPSDLIAQLASS